MSIGVIVTLRFIDRMTAYLQAIRESLRPPGERALRIALDRRTLPW